MGGARVVQETERRAGVPVSPPLVVPKQLRSGDEDDGEDEGEGEGGGEGGGGGEGEGEEEGEEEGEIADGRSNGGCIVRQHSRNIGVLTPTCPR